MLKLGCGIAAIALVFMSGSGIAADPLAIGRQMLAEDNPGELFIDRGKALFYEKRGPRKVSMEQCDFGLGPGKIEGAAARLPRYFPDTDSVQDLESRLVTCMVELQGFNRADVIKKAISPANSHGSDIENLALYITSRSNGMKMDISLRHRKEKEMYKAGEYLFYRRAGQTDFACNTCHGESGKRIRLQDLVNMTDKQQLQEVVATWPAYRGAHDTIRTMQWRLSDCIWQMRLPDLNYGSDFTIAMTTFLHYQGNGAVIRVPGFKR
ncbi:MAG: sulfur oxidation c-type cytochrome SoxA [Burkholderiales bacterium]